MGMERLGIVTEAVRARLLAAIAAEPPSVIRDGMAYACEGGKGLRGFLVVESARLFDLDGAEQAGAAVEALHAYSLVHDDLPAMDDDDLRRGRPTVHVKWDDAVAVLVGDALQTLAFGLLADPGASPDAAVRADLVLSLARASGAGGMVLGQAQDIAAETAAAPLSLGEIITLQRNKTGALIRWSAEAGARLAGADPAPLSAYAAALGLAFQIADDILDVTGDPEKAGKRLQKDAEAGKATFVGLLGLDGAKARATSLAEEACDALAPFGDRAETLRDVARFVISRER
ncbi:polyprenyl synthetase family protein [Poseidonocella sp. HB161398]|uniref:polyprenyl synthetase family protein n=1 Tax=Poseidonocella sp. HB161398 TaxID=2320855 RepID=UPI001107F8F2|nr:polyprenyl synthetase family protein [Poseidonocella sp. HB161398]